MNIDTVLSTNINILLVSSNQATLETLQKSMHDTWEEQSQDCRQYQECNIHTSHNVQPILDNQLHIDFLVILIDPSLMTSLHEAEDNVKSVQDTLGRQRICLVALGLDYSSVISSAALWKFSQLYQIGFLIGTLNQHSFRRHLSERLLNFCEDNIGMANGIPAVRKY